MVFIWLHCQRSLFCALVTLERQKWEGPIDWVSWLWNACVPAWMAHPHQGGNRARSYGGTRYTRSGWFRGPSQVEGYSYVVQSLKLMNPIPVISGVTCCCGPGRFSKLPSALQPECVNGTVTLTMHGKDFGIRSALLFPCSILGSDLPLAIVSKD